MKALVYKGYGSQNNKRVKKWAYNDLVGPYQESCQLSPLHCGVNGRSISIFKAVMLVGFPYLSIGISCSAGLLHAAILLFFKDSLMLLPNFTVAYAMNASLLFKQSFPMIGPYVNTSVSSSSVPSMYANRFIDFLNLFPFQCLVFLGCHHLISCQMI